VRLLGVLRLPWSRGSELAGLAGDSFYVGLWQGAISVADLIQLALIAHMLGVTQLGKLSLVMSFVVLVGQFFDVRVGTASTTFGARRFHEADFRGAAGVFQLSYLMDAATGVLGFAVVAALAPVVGPHLVHNDGTNLILLFAVTLLVSTVDETSLTILRVLDRFRLIAAYTVVLQALRIAFVVAALMISRSLTAVLVALIFCDVAAAIANAAFAAIAFRRSSGLSIRARALGAFLEKRRMLRMMFHTNLVSYARLAQVQLPTLLVGSLSGVTQAGVYRIGTAAGNMIGRLADPAYAAVLPRLARLWAAAKKAEIRRLVGRATLIALLVMVVALTLLVIYRELVLRLLGGHAALASGTVLVLAGIAQAVDGVLFWNVGLLFAAGRSRRVSRIVLGGTALQIALLVPLTIAYEASGAAIAFCVTTILTNLVLAAFAISALVESGSTPDLGAARLATPSAD
jgi:O-antigen/teichoic acid export membrane protein